MTTFTFQNYMINRSVSSKKNRHPVVNNNPVVVRMYYQDDGMVGFIFIS